MNIGNDRLTITATNPAGALASAQSVPAVVDWQWHYHVPLWPQWAALGLLLVGVRANRRWQAWLILVPVLLALVFWQMLVKLTGMPPQQAESGNLLWLAFAGAWAGVWMVAVWPRRSAGLVIAPAVMAALGGLAYIGCRGLVWADFPYVAVVFGVFSVPLLVGMALSSWCCRENFGRWRFMLWLGLWMAIAGALVSVAVGSVVLTIQAESPEELLRHLGELVIATVFGTMFAGMIYLLNLPFMILAFEAPLYRERFRRSLGISDNPFLQMREDNTLEQTS